MNAHDVQTMIAQSLNLHADAAINDGDPDTPDRIEELRAILNYEQAGVMTTDAGMVLCFDDNTEFQVTIVRSR